MRSKRHLNSPLVNRKYNYVYQITNNINGKTYIGVHRTDNMDDGYMGSGVYLKRAIQQYGVENFDKKILYTFDTYQEALNKERELVTEDYINLKSNYNLREGGYGNCAWSKEALGQFSDIAKARWQDPEYRKKMEVALNSEERITKISKKVRAWIAEHPEEHAIRMDKINKNPEKIEKMASKHRGMRRSEEACANVSAGLKDFIDNNPEKAKVMCGVGCEYIHNPSTGEIRRLGDGEDIPAGWASGSGPKNSDAYKGLNLGTAFATNDITGVRKRFKSAEDIPEGWTPLKREKRSKPPKYPNGFKMIQNVSDLNEVRRLSNDVPMLSLIHI